ncbi:MAG: hypothetical protein WA822_10010, partial [Albidovulum sp.]
PYYQLAKILKDRGHVRDQRKILIYAEEDARRHERHRHRLRRRFTRNLRRLGEAPTKINLDKAQEAAKQLPIDMRAFAQMQIDKFVERYSSKALPDHPLIKAPISPLTQSFARRDFCNRMRNIAAWDRFVILRNHVVDHTLNLIVGYGYRPLRSVGALFILWVVASLLAYAAWDEGSFAPNSDVILSSDEWTVLANDSSVYNPAKSWSDKHAAGQDWETFSPWAYGFDIVVPILNVGQTDAWAPSTNRRGWGWRLWWARWFLSSFGWIISALGAAAITGLIRRD